MKCPYCGCLESKVIDSRQTDEGNAIRRRRECEECKNRFTTYEKVEQISLMVIKKDRVREYFDREKILRGVVKSCEKRPVSMEQMEKIVDSIEKEIMNSMQREISSEKIGEMVMDHLKIIDEVSYVRFASVYRRFQDLDSFKKELDRIMAEK